MKNDFAKIDRLALAMVRENKERSKALPERAYHDPCQYLIHEEETDQRRKQQIQRKAKGSNHGR